MKRKRHSPEQIIAKLHEADAVQATGTSATSCLSLRLSSSNCFSWRTSAAPIPANFFFDPQNVCLLMPILRHTPSPACRSRPDAARTRSARP